MTFKDDAIAALTAGQNAEIGDPNPYNPGRLMLAQCCVRGYNTMLTIRFAGTPAMQQYLQGRARR